MAKPILVLALLLASPVQAQETLPLRSGLGEVEITVTDGGGGYIVGASILLSGPTERQALSVAHGTEFEDLPPGRYQVTIRMADSSETHHTMTIIGGVRYATLWTVGPSPPPAKEPSAPSVSTLGPLSVSQMTIDPVGNVKYVTTNRSHLLMFQRIEIGRVYADGSLRQDFWQLDTFHERAVSWLKIGFSLFSGLAPVYTEGVHSSRSTGRADVPVKAEVRVVAVATANEPPLGDNEVIAALIERRQTLVSELEYWIGRYEARMRDFGGVTLSDLILEELEIPRSGDGSSDSRLALLNGIRSVRRGGWDDVVANRVILAQLKSMVQFHDFAVDHLRLLRGR